MTRHLAKALDAIWYVCMGLYLGLTAGLVLSVIMTFRGAREIDATPGIEPYSDPMFAAYHNDAVAGYIGQDLFMVGGTVGFGLLVIAVISRLVLATSLFNHLMTTGNKLAGRIRATAIVICIMLAPIGGNNILGMNVDWPDLYDQSADDYELDERRIAFEADHKKSERTTSAAWLCGLIALSISPWCRRIADFPSKDAEYSQQQ